MTESRSQKPTEGESTTALTPVQIGAALGVAALVWMIADWFRWL